MCIYIYICRRLQSSAFFLQWHVRRRKISKLGTKFSFRQILWREPPLSANQIHLNSYGIHREFRRRSAWKRPNKSSGQTLPRSRFNTLGQGTNFRCIKTTSRSGERSCFNSLLGTNFFFFFFEERIFVTGKNSFSPLIIYGGRKILSFFFQFVIHVRNFNYNVQQIWKSLVGNWKEGKFQPYQDRIFVEIKEKFFLINYSWEKWSRSFH